MADDADSLALANLAACYADGIDLIGAGKAENGIARRRDCFGADGAQVTAHLQAWHGRKDGGTALGLGTWAVGARKTVAGWRIVEEILESPLRVVIPRAD